MSRPNANTHGAHVGESTPSGHDAQQQQPPHRSRRSRSAPREENEMQPMAAVAPSTTRRSGSNSSPQRLTPGSTLLSESRQLQRAQNDNAPRRPHEEPAQPQRQMRHQQHQPSPPQESRPRRQGTGNLAAPQAVMRGGINNSAAAAIESEVHDQSELNELTSDAVQRQIEADIAVEEESNAEHNENNADASAEEARKRVRRGNFPYWSRGQTRDTDEPPPRFLVGRHRARSGATSPDNSSFRSDTNNPGPSEQTLERVDSGRAPSILSSSRYQRVSRSRNVTPHLHNGSQTSNDNGTRSSLLELKFRASLPATAAAAPPPYNPRSVVPPRVLTQFEQQQMERATHMDQVMLKRKQQQRSEVAAAPYGTSRHHESAPPYSRERRAKDPAAAVRRRKGRARRPRSVWRCMQRLLAYRTMYPPRELLRKRRDERLQKILRPRVGKSPERPSKELDEMVWDATQIIEGFFSRYTANYGRDIQRMHRNRRHDLLDIFRCYNFVVSAVLDAVDRDMDQLNLYMRSALNGFFMGEASDDASSEASSDERDVSMTRLSQLSDDYGDSSARDPWLSARLSPRRRPSVRRNAWGMEGEEEGVESDRSGDGESPPPVHHTQYRLKKFDSTTATRQTAAAAAAAARDSANVNASRQRRRPPHLLNTVPLVSYEFAASGTGGAAFAVPTSSSRLQSFTHVSVPAERTAAPVQPEKTRATARTSSRHASEPQRSRRRNIPPSPLLHDNISARENKAAIPKSRRGSRRKQRQQEKEQQLLASRDASSVRATQRGVTASPARSRLPLLTASEKCKPRPLRAAPQLQHPQKQPTRSSSKAQKRNTSNSAVPDLPPLPHSAESMRRIQEEHWRDIERINVGVTERRRLDRQERKEKRRKLKRTAATVAALKEASHSFSSSSSSSSSTSADPYNFSHFHAASAAAGPPAASARPLAAADSFAAPPVGLSFLRPLRRRGSVPGSFLRARESVDSRGYLNVAPNTKAKYTPAAALHKSPARPTHRKQSLSYRSTSQSGSMNHLRSYEMKDKNGDDYFTMSEIDGLWGRGGSQQVSQVNSLTYSGSQWRTADGRSESQSPVLSAFNSAAPHGPPTALTDSALFRAPHSGSSEESKVNSLNSQLVFSESERGSNST